MDAQASGNFKGLNLRRVRFSRAVRSAKEGGRLKRTASAAAMLIHIVENKSLPEATMPKRAICRFETREEDCQLPYRKKGEIQKNTPAAGEDSAENA
jgi:hypothetical protein